MSGYIRSGRNSPCPVCGRVKDSDCRWRLGEIVLCHSGTDLHIGETITIDGIEWALVNTNGGFSGQAATFIPHDPAKAKQRRQPVPTTANDLISRQSAKVMWADAIAQFYAAFDDAWSVPDFYSLPPDQLKTAYALIINADQMAASLARNLQKVWREHKDLKHLHQLRVQQYIKNIQYQRHDIESFYRNELGTPCPVAVEQTEASR